jgi:hypothetical protein
MSEHHDAPKAHDFHTVHEDHTKGPSNPKDPPPRLTRPTTLIEPRTPFASRRGLTACPPPQLHRVPPTRAPARREPHEVPRRDPHETLSTPQNRGKPANPLKPNTISLLPTWQMSYGALGILEVLSKKWRKAQRPRWAFRS